MGDTREEVHFMKEEVCNVNSKISVDCLERRYPKIDIQKDIVDSLNKKYNFYVRVPSTEQYERLEAHHLSDRRYWMDNFAYDKLYSEIIEVTGNPGLGYGMGREFFLDNEMMHFLGPIISPKGVIEHMPETMERWNHTKKGTVIENSDGHFKFAIAHNPGIIVSSFAVDYHLGIFDGVAETCGLVGFETQLVKADTKTHYYEFEGRYEFENRPIRIFNQYVVKKLPHVRRSLEVARKMTINSREASIRERLSKEKEERGKNNLKKFVSTRVIKQCIDDDKEPERTLEEKYFAIMFSDIRNFTDLSEKVDKKILAKVLNQYFEELMHPIQGHNGEVDKILGDCIMAFFPTAYDAVSCSIDMRYALKEFNHNLKTQNIPNLSFLRAGIGISTGNMLLGNIGSPQRMNETVIGDIVNTGSRLEGLTKEYKVPIIIDEDTYKDIEQMGMIANEPAIEGNLEQILKEGKVFTREIDVVYPKGKKNQVRIYEVVVPRDL